MERTRYMCTEPSHPPILYNSGSPSLFRHISSEIARLQQEGLSEETTVEMLVNDVGRMLNSPRRNWDDGLVVQNIQRTVAKSWQDVFRRIEHIGFLVGWFINECAQERNAGELHRALCDFVFESNRTLFAIVNQLRSALADDTFVYLRTLHETLVKSRFLRKYTEEDPDLPGRFIYYTNKAYKKFYERFAQHYGQNAAKRMWIETEEHYKDKIQPNAKGDYAWAYPLVKDGNGNAKVRPTFFDLRKAVDNESAFSTFYYDVAAEKTHGKFVWNPLMIQPEARCVRFESFSDENTGLVLDLMLPMYEEMIENTASTCITPSHALVMSVVKAVLKDIRNAVRAAIASNPERYGHFQQLSRPGSSRDDSS